MKRIRQDEPMPIKLTQVEQDLILKHTFVEGDVHTQIEEATKTGRGNLKFRPTPDQLDELLEWIAEGANHNEERSLVSRLDALYNKLERVEASLDVQD